MGEMTQNLAWMVWYHDSMVHRGSQELTLGWIADKMHSSSLYSLQAPKGSGSNPTKPQPPVVRWSEDSEFGLYSLVLMVCRRSQELELG